MDRLDRKEEEQELGTLQDTNNRFDASQYAFFGRDVTQEIELGGLDDEDEDIGHLNELEDDDAFSSSIGREEIGAFDVSSEVGDVGELTSSFLKLSAVDSESDRFQEDSGFLERDVHDLPVDLSFTDNNESERKQWIHKQLLQRQQDLEITRSSGTGQQQQQWWGRETSSQNYSLSKSHGWSGQPQVSTTSISPSVGSPYRQQFANPQMGPAAMQYGSVGFPPQVGTTGPWLQSTVAPVISGTVPGAVRHPHPSQQSPLTPAQVMLQYQRSQGFHGVPPPYGQMHSQQQGINVPPQAMQKPDATSMAEFRDLYRGRQTPRGSPDAVYAARKTADGQPQMRSKYMTTDEIETIVRIQWAATHGSDPYIDDYYHQAMQAKVAGGTPHGRRHFAPSHLRELPSHTRSAAEPHAYLQVDALGRIPFSSIRRPRPLLDVDGVNGAGEKTSADNASTQRRLEQEPMLAARIAVEDGLCLLLDVDDIDRMLAAGQHPDGGVQLRRRRQMLLEGLAASLQLVDPLAPGSSLRESNGRFGLAGKDDLVFLRLVSLPKGRKLLSRYLRLLVPGSDLVRIVLMAVFRHLRFLFGGLHSDPSAAASSTGLANTVANTVKSMDLPSLSACLAAVVLAPEPPPLRPIGSPSGDGATVVLQVVLDRATSILTDRSVHYPLQSTAVWQASFDAFFSLLSKYCSNKYESIMHSLMMASSGNSAAINTAAAAAMTREMPIELLRASLPHTNEQQRKRLLEFAQRSIVMGGGMHSGNVGDSHVNTAAVRG